ncbi:MAG: glycoside hydrolase family 15 protein [Chloroflexi bacterium]|nr:glycoside hydrolase family 15 protein [Chloroflexota bacterium]
MDSPAVLAGILDRDAGRFRVAPVDAEAAAPPTHRYLPDSLVLETTWTLPGGTLVVQDALTTDATGTADGALVRLARCTSRAVEVRIECRLAPGFAGAVPVEPLRLRLEGALEATVDRGPATGTIRLSAGESAAVALCWGDAHVPSVADAERRIATTVAHQHAWLRAGSVPDPDPTGLLARSALTLQGLIHRPTGAVMAAATTSLPEAPGGNRNWDYRYTWIRDGVCTMTALHALGFRAEAHAFLDFLAGRVEAAPLQIMYGVGGELDLPERTLDTLSGYEGARPVRVGNGAVGQRQLDAWGWILDLLLRDLGTDDVDARAPDARMWAMTIRLAEEAAAAWRLPDQGIWEIRGEPRHFSSSKLMCWVALDRAARIGARVAGQEAGARSVAWRAEADLVRDDLLEHAVDARGVFTQCYGEAPLDASLLLVPLMGFLPPDDPRVRATVLAIADELTEDGLVLRYRPDTAADDGVSRDEEGSFTICSFWLVSALARIGRRQEAETLMERLLSFASPLGLYAEEIDTRTGRHLGNTPQAFSHLALLGAALDLARTGAARA